MTSVRPGSAMSLLHRIAVTATVTVCVPALVLLLSPAAAQAAISAVSEPPIPASPGVATIDTFNTALVPAFGNLGLADVRKIRQTFKNPATFDVGQIVLGFDVGTGVGGFSMSFFEVEDVNGANWDATLPAAVPLVTRTYYNTLPGTTTRLGFNLSGADVFTLPARFAGTTGYAIEFTTVDQFSNPGQFRHSNTNPTDTSTTPPTNPDYYVDGRYFTQTGASTNGNRDFGLWLAVADPNIPAAGDVDGLNGVNLDDLTIIAANFRVTGPKTRAQGDLTGDGVVDIFDFRDWKSHYPLANSGGGSFEAILGIPEPTSCLLLLIGCAGIGRCRRRR